MFGVCDALVELTGVLPRGAPQGDVINISRFYGREMHVFTILQRAGDVEPITLNVLSTIWSRLKGKGGSTFGRLTANLWKETPTIAEYDETAKKKTTAYVAKLKGMLTFTPEWEYDSQDGMATVRDYQRIPTLGWTAIQQAKYIETLHSVALEDGIHLRTSSMLNEIRVAPINCSPEDDAWDITYTFLKSDRRTGPKAGISNLEPVHVGKTSTDPSAAGFTRAVADGGLARSFRTWAHTFIPKAAAIAPGLLASSGEAESDWVKPAARFANFQAASAAATAKGTEESKSEESKFEQLLATMATQAAQAERNLSQMRETQAQPQQSQSQMMQILGMIFAGQEQQRLTNGWVTESITTISASSGCAIEAAPAPQAAIAMLPALVPFAAQSAPAGATPDPDLMVTEATSATAAAGSTTPAAGTSGGRGARRSPPARASGPSRDVRRTEVLPRRLRRRSRAPLALRPARRAGYRRTTARLRRLRRWTGLAMATMTTCNTMMTRRTG